MNHLLSALRGAGEATRLRIIALLSKGELTVGELVQILDQSQPRVSRHLKLMGEAGLLNRFQEGTQVFYRLANDGVAGSLNAALVDILERDVEVLEGDIQSLVSIRQERADKAQSYFQENAADWNRLRSLYVAEEQVEAELLKQQGQGQIRSLLDIGTGTGRMLELFAPQAEQALGIDVSRAMLNIARANLDGKDLGHAQVRLGDMYELGLEEASQDLIVFHQVLHFAEFPARALDEAGRVLAPEGKILIADFAPHEEEFLRDEHAHRRLGFEDGEIEQWGNSTGLKLNTLSHLDGGKLRVTIWNFGKKG
ncbi:MAG: metalloregulator ArsR/SmtB family transcription factor [Kordiimonadaceae bacterium]|nr:metalloregulator ArsR/SmtB family transcription factor [Kordiimonadaceae bacterium]MBO6567114.1 metalloregulator ArsR/SmtB family transcription factor [Kordiimonadaceae bacterium]MBO6963671.1 metalloregulator ArsR/SmtB family transcription factor [Kordiimonadaceae bacterium]